MRSLDFVEKSTLRRNLPPFRVGDAVRVHVKVREEKKERIQVFEGVVIRRRGASVGETFTVRKVSNGVGVERIFPIQSPAVAKVEIKSRGFVRRSRLYYLRKLTGRKARLHSKVRDLSDLLSPDEKDGPDEQELAALPALPEEGESSGESTEVAEEASAADAEGAASANSEAEAGTESEGDKSS